MRWRAAHDWPVVLGLSVAATATYAVWAGQDTNWDQRNYHLYVVYAWLTGRTFVDVAPAQLQTWHNPIASLPQYLSIRHLPPVFAGLALGALAGMNGPLLWVLTRRLQRGERGGPAIACAACVTLMGLTGPVFVSQIGTTFAEYLCSPLVLGALIVLTPAEADARPGARALAVAGVLLGAAVGLKLVNLVYCLGLGVALVALRMRLRLLASHAAGLACGMLATGGYWGAYLWSVSGNPMFPYYNAVFRSPLWAPVNFVDMRFVPPSVVHAAITYPMAWFLGLHPTSELPFRDARFALLAAFLPVACVATAVRRLRGDAGAGLTTGPPYRFWLLAVFFAVSYLIWLRAFGIQRYALPLELTAGLLLLLSLDRVLRTRGELVAVFALLASFAILWSRPSDWGRVPYGRDWVGLEHAPAGPPTLYVMVGGGEPMSHLIPWWSPTDRFVRLTGNAPLEPDQPLGSQAQAAIAGHAGPIRSLSVRALDPDDRDRLARFGLAPADEPSCAAFRTRVDRFIACDLTRTTATAPGP